MYENHTDTPLEVRVKAITEASKTLAAVSSCEVMEGGGRGGGREGGGKEEGGGRREREREEGREGDFRILALQAHDISQWAALLPSLPPSPSSSLLLSLPPYLEVRHGHVPEQSKLLLYSVILEVILPATA